MHQNTHSGAVTHTRHTRPRSVLIGNRVTHAVVAVDNAAHRLAQQALQTDNEQATWAGRRGLLATWACEECYRNLMRAAIHQDDRTASGCSPVEEFLGHAGMSPDVAPAGDRLVWR